ncbi:hypothetical protein HYW75_06605 [Candidatus Pacearchaeota archaeon]|nr:hypothetical protein [Candidatus Pacearchaeota archaeon]
MGNDKYLDKILDEISLSLLTEYIRKRNEDEEKPSSCIYLYGSRLEDLLYISGKMHEHFTKKGFSDVEVNFGECRLNNPNGKIYQFDVDEFIKLNERAKKRDEELKQIRMSLSGIK